MKASELRVGNWVLNKRYKSGYEMQIESIGEFGLNVELGYDGLNPVIDDDCGFNECEPIPLTDEWAVKFGYENMHEMCMDFIDNCFFRIDIDFEDFSKLQVHQLQNLYFALTNEELTLND